MRLTNVDWQAVITDAVSRVDWVRSQAGDTDGQLMLLPMAGDGPAVPVTPAPEPVRTERRRAVTRERMSRLLGQRKGGRWAGREGGRPVGTFDPATITPEQAAAVLLIVRRYVARHASPLSQAPLCPEAQDETVSRIIHAIWTRDYSGSDVGAGDLAGAVWSACSLYRRTSWIGESVFARREARRVKVDVPIDTDPTRRGGGADNPARIVAAIDAAAHGLSAPVVVNRGRKQTRRARGRKRMPAVSAEQARAVLCGE